MAEEEIADAAEDDGDQRQRDAITQERVALPADGRCGFEGLRRGRRPNLTCSGLHCRGLHGNTARRSRPARNQCVLIFCQHAHGAASRAVGSDNLPATYSKTNLTSVSKSVVSRVTVVSRSASTAK